MNICKTLLLVPLLTCMGANSSETLKNDIAESPVTTSMQQSKTSLKEPLALSAAVSLSSDSAVSVAKVQTAITNQFDQPLIFERSLSKPGSNSIGIGFSHDILTKGRGEWIGAHLRLEHRFAPRTLIYANVQQTNKFGLDDTQLMAGGYYPLPHSITLNVEGSYSGTHHVIAKDSILVSLQFPLSAGWFFTSGIKQSDYTQGPSTQEFGMLERYYKNYRTAFTLMDTQSLGENMLGERFTFSKYYNDISFFSISLGNGREVDRSQGKKIFLNTRSIGINGRNWFNQNWAVDWALTESQEGNAYNHTGMFLGLFHNF